MCFKLKITHLLFAYSVYPDRTCLRESNKWKVSAEVIYGQGVSILINLFVWNKAALIKQLWAIASEKDGLWVKSVHSSYFIRHDEWIGSTLSRRWVPNFIPMLCSSVVLFFVYGVWLDDVTPFLLVSNKILFAGKKKQRVLILSTKNRLGENFLFFKSRCILRWNNYIQKVGRNSQHESILTFEHAQFLHVLHSADTP